MTSYSKQIKYKELIATSFLDRINVGILVHSRELQLAHNNYSTTKYKNNME